jgi:hypothetical protein
MNSKRKKLDVLIAPSMHSLYLFHAGIAYLTKNSPVAQRLVCGDIPLAPDFYTCWIQSMHGNETTIFDIYVDESNDYRYMGLEVLRSKSPSRMKDVKIQRFTSIEEYIMELNTNHTLDYSEDESQESQSEDKSNAESEHVDVPDLHNKSVSEPAGHGGAAVDTDMSEPSPARHEDEANTDNTSSKRQSSRARRPAEYYESGSDRYYYFDRKGNRVYLPKRTRPGP